MFYDLYAQSEILVFICVEEFLTTTTPQKKKKTQLSQQLEDC